MLESVRKPAVIELTNLGVKMMPKTKVTSVTVECANTIIKRWHDVVRYGASLHPDPWTVAQHGFAPVSMRNADGYLKQMKMLLVEGHPNIFAVGNAGNLEPNRATHTESQAAHLIKNLLAVLAGG
ncbi:hypothetical protein ACHAQJ_007179 [Trichoderma viride]